MNRRHFLTRSLCGAGIVLMGRSVSSAAAPTTPWRMRLSTSSIQFRDLPIEEVCRRIAALGFEGIDIWSAYENCPHLDDVAKRLGGAGLKELLAKNKLKLCSFSTYVGGYLKYAELLGQASGGLAIQGSAGPCKSNELASRMKAFLESIQPLVELAEKHNSYLAIENHGQSLLDALDSFKAFVDRNTSQRVGVALAPYHLQAIHASVEEAIAICGPQLFFFYAWQKEPDLGQLPGQGPTDFKPWLKALARINYRGYVNPFMHGHPKPDVISAALVKAREYLSGAEVP